jgi:TolB-like protein
MGEPQLEQTSPPTQPVSTGSGAPTDPRSDDKKAKRKNKVRAAWISFIGRIVAQSVGAAATIGLGFAVLGQYHEASASASDGSLKTAPLVERGSVRLRTRPNSSDPALAVLPFRDLSPGLAHERLADGISEMLVAALARLGTLRVLSRTSSLHYAGLQKPMPEIAGEMDADLILEGSVARAGDVVRVVARLIDARSDEHRWVGRYDLQSKDLLTEQADVADLIAREIASLRGRDPRFNQ